MARNISAGRKHFPFFYGWIIATLTFFALSTFGIRISFGAYFTTWEEDFIIGRTVVALISTLGWVSFAVFQPVIGKLLDRYGSRYVLSCSVLLIGITLLLSSVAAQFWQMIVFLGVIASIGFAGTSSVAATSVVAHWFVEKRGLVLGFVTSGMAVGHLIIVPVTFYLIANYDWRLAMVVMGLAMTFLLAPLCYLFIRSRPEEIGLHPYGEKKTAEQQRPVQPVAENFKGLKPVSVFKERDFWQLTIPYFFCGFTDVGLIGSHFIPFAEGKGFSLPVIALVFSVVAAFNIAGTIGTGYMSDRFNRSKLLASIYTIRGFTFILLLTAKTPLSLLIFAAVYGATEMASIAPTSSLCVHLFKADAIGTIFSFIAVSHHLGAAAGSFFAGLSYDLTGSYYFIFILAIILIWGSALTVSRIRDAQVVCVNI
ncbi:MAG: MFS transporter [Bacillota bacterium]